ncbi:g-patch domain-containing protein [Phthorimaea operculella]|nr:g-patch domain-containing protein [Phthorimaea operculella]
MEANCPDTQEAIEKPKRKHRKKFSLRRLRLSLKYRPEILKLVLKMRHCIKNKNSIMKKLKKQLKEVQNAMEEALSKNANEEANLDQSKTVQTKNSFTQTKTTVKLNDPNQIQSKWLASEEKSETSDSKVDNSGWELKPDEEGKSIADQVKEAAQSALQQSGMVYVESAGMYYDYKTGYYYNSELGLYYHTDTNCYYYYNEDKKEFAFHSYPDRSAVAVNPSLEAHEKRKARKQRKAQQKEEEVNSLAKSLSQGDGPRKAKRRKKDKEQKKEKKVKKEKKGKKYSEVSETPPEKSNDDDTEKPEEKDTEETKEKSESAIAIDDSNDGPKTEEGDGDGGKNGAEELEDGECSDTASEKAEEEEEESSDEESNASTASLVDDDMVAKHHPPCMRVIVRETTLPKLKVGSLFLITKDGGTVGREGEHTILLRDANVSRNHLEIKYDMCKRMYTATDLGSKNGSFLNGVLMAESQVASLPMEVMHGSILQLGETKLLCHIHPGNDTCGHCEPGLIMETQEKEKVAYTRTCDVKKQYELELARLKNKYKPEPLMIEDGSYNDRAKARRETVGSSHSSEKTQATDTETHIAPENKGFKLLQKMGWSKGEGLGKDNQGETAPLFCVIDSPGRASCARADKTKNYYK